MPTFSRNGTKTVRVPLYILFSPGLKPCLGAWSLWTMANTKFASGNSGENVILCHVLVGTEILSLVGLRRERLARNETQLEMHKIF